MGQQQGRDKPKERRNGIEKVTGNEQQHLSRIRINLHLSHVRKLVVRN